MQNKPLSLDDVMISSPCSVGWENMAGDDRKRFCQQCRLNVYNTSQMTRSEISDLLSTDGKSCLQIYRRADGTMMTADCPVGLRRIRNGARRLAKVAAALWAFIVSCAGVSAQVEPEKKSACQPVDQTAAVKSDGGAKAKEKDDSEFPRLADDLAFKSLEKARDSLDKKDSKEADVNFKKAVELLAKGKHDPAFKNLVYLEYSNFLVSQHEPNEASAMRANIIQAAGPSNGHDFAFLGVRAPTRAEREPIIMPTGIEINF